MCMLESSCTDRTCYIAIYILFTLIYKIIYSYILRDAGMKLNFGNDRHWSSNRIFFQARTYLWYTLHKMSFLTWWFFLYMWIFFKVYRFYLTCNSNGFYLLLFIVLYFNRDTLLKIKNNEKKYNKKKTSQHWQAYWTQFI